MLTLKLDAQGALLVRWPATAEEILELGRRYAEKENSLPPAERVPLPDLGRVTKLFETARAAHETAGKSETTRAVSSEKLNAAMAKAKPLLREALIQLKARHLKSLAQLREWGLSTKQGQRGLSVLSPKTDPEWRAFLLDYVARESEQPEPLRIADPPLASLAELAAVVRDSEEARTTGRVDRSKATEARDQALATLRERLQIAAVVLLEQRFDGVVQRPLAEWGFDIVEQSTSSPRVAPAPGDPESFDSEVKPAPGSTPD